jgi:hypothetical protein
VQEGQEISATGRLFSVLILFYKFIQNFARGYPKIASGKGKVVPVLN